MENVSTYLETLIRETRKPEAEIMTMAFQAGLKHLWRESVLGKYIRQEISREEAIDAIGIDWVELAERQYQAVKEDIAWALQE